MINYCAFLLAQPLSFSPEFASVKSSVPIQILNPDTSYFYVLRYNKTGHDFTVEKRGKSDYHIVAFTPLKLDSVNANWFNYEKLDYLFYAKDGRAYFIFEKVLNTKRSVFVKEIDESGKAGGFTELATLDYDATLNHYRFKFNITANGNLLIVGQQYYLNGTAKNVAMLYDLKQREKVWIKKLPLENLYTGFSEVYECNYNNDLYYLLCQTRITGYKRRFVNHAQINIPEFSCDSFIVACFAANSKSAIRRNLNLRDSIGKKSVTLIPGKADLSILIHGFKQNEADYGEVFFTTKKYTNNLQSEIYSNTQKLSEEMAHKLTFYDASDYKEPCDKDYPNTQCFADSDFVYVMAGRDEENYYKELLLLKAERGSGKIVSQQIVPRKIFFFDDRTRYKNIGFVAGVLAHKSFRAFLLEDIHNAPLPATKFNFKKFSRQKYLWGANLVCYLLKPDGSYLKEIIYTNAEFDFVPLKYQGNQPEFVFYLNAGTREKFVILKLNP